MARQCDGLPTGVRRQKASQAGRTARFRRRLVYKVPMSARSPQTLKADICVIGGGPGGLSVAAAAAGFGVPTVLIERRKMGGDCLNTGCVPSKALLAAAKRAEAIRSAGAFGLDAPNIGVNFAKVHDHVHGVIAAVAPADSAERFTGLGVRVIRGTRNSRTATQLSQAILKSARGVL